jgi:diguanylate cyclase (GGDEF)-like protein/PAS domain S-box-containing protein
MITREGIRTWFAQRSVWLAIGAAAVLALIVLTVSSQWYWQRRASELARANLNLQLARLSSEISRQSEMLEARALELADSEPVAQLLQDGAAAAPDRSAILELTHHGVDALAVVSTAKTVLFSAAVAQDQLTDVAPQPAMLRLPDSGSPPPIFVDDRWIAVRAVRARGAAGTIAGWVIVSRSLSAPLIAQLARSVDGSLAAHPLAEADPSLLPPELVEPVVAGAAPSGGVPTALARDASSGYAALREANGRVAWVFRVTPAAPKGISAAACILAALMVLGVIASLAVFAFKRYVRQQKSVDARYKAIIDQASDGIVIVDAQTQGILYSNSAFLAPLGYTGEEARALTLKDIFADGNASPESMLVRLRDASSQMAMNLQQRCKNGSFIDIEVRCNALDVDGSDVLAYVTHDVSLRKKVEQQLIDNQNRLDRMAHHDQLTGLPNRHYLATFLPEAIVEATAAGTMLGVVFLDLDRFKHINDTRGHETGDKLLQEVGTRLRAVVRDSDVVIRMGGDEFVVVFRNVKSYDEVTLGAGRIIETLNRPIVIDQHPLQTTGSVGVSMFPRDGSNMVELLKHSDTAMYQAKDRGRNNVQMFSQVMNRKLKHRVAVEASLREALRLKQLDVHYQPFINLQTRKIVGLEALMRWRHPTHGMIPADQFIPVAEETGLIVPMGNFVLHRTLQNMNAWRKAGVPLVPMSLNIAPAQLQRGELQSTISTLLKTHGIRPELLQLEMTERAIFDSHNTPAGENRQDTMARLRDIGIKIAIDDFGTGYSSLSYLKHWRVDALKIDRSFVRDLVTDSSDLAIVSAIIAIARHLNIQVIAEGIEAYQQAEILRRLGCTVGQGFLFARPVPADECLALLADNADPEAVEEDMLAAFSAGRG